MHLIPEASHDCFVLVEAGEDLHLVVGILDSQCHGCVVLFSRFHIVICAFGRDQPDGSCALVNCLVYTVKWFDSVISVTTDSKI